MRIVFGAVLFVAVADIAPVLFTFLSDDGVMPRRALLDGLVRSDRFSLFWAVGPKWLLVALYGVTLLSLASLCVGYRTKVSNVAAFVLVCGLHERDLMLFDGADNVIRVMLFWMLFMPAGARYSVDAVLAASRGAPLRGTGCALPIRLGQLQIAWVYANTIMHKWPGSQWHDGNALHTALGLEHLFTRPLGKLLYSVPWFTHYGTHFAIIAERAFLPLVFLPLFPPRPMKAWLERQSPAIQSTLRLFFQPTYKALALFYGTALHLGIAVTMSVGNFSYVMISSYLLFFETAWTVALVEQVGRVWRRLYRGSTLKVLYDGECGICTRVARVLGGLDVFGTLELIDFRRPGALDALPSVVPQALEQRMHVVAPDGSSKAGYQGFVAVARRLPALALLGVLGSLPGARLLGDPVYDYIARRRRELHPKCDESCAAFLAPPPGIRDALGRLVPRAARRAAVAVLFGGLVYLAGASAWFSLPSSAMAFGRKVDPDTHMPQWMASSVQGLELWQKWDMFSPNPADTDIYLVGRGELADGTHVDVLRGDGHGGPMPPTFPGLFFNRWTKFVHNIAYAGKPWLLEFGKFVCRHWNDEAPAGRAQLKTFQIYRAQRRVPEPGKEPGAWGEQLIWDHRCF
jgi:predicted DCC family thiol-disulfide oxidoreductase YuxK